MPSIKELLKKQTDAQRQIIQEALESAKRIVKTAEAAKKAGEETAKSKAQQSQKK
jgi:hypothetical protein